MTRNSTKKHDPFHIAIEYLSQLYHLLLIFPMYSTEMAKQIAIFVIVVNKKASVMVIISSIQHLFCKYHHSMDALNSLQSKKNCKFKTILYFLFRVENDDSITEQATSKQNGNATDTSAVDPFDRDALANSPRKGSSTVGLSLRNLTSMTRNAQGPSLTNGDSGGNPIMLGNSTIALDSESESSMHNQSYKHRSTPKNPSSAKFEAFGTFVASSLIDLPETNALELVERFTSEIVKALITSKTPAITPDKD